MSKKLLAILYILIVITVAALLTASFIASKTYSWQKSTETITETGPQEKTLTFLAAGDIMLSRNVAAAVKKADDPLLLFRSLDQLLRSTDFNFANLESPINGTDAANPSPSLIFNSPSYTLKGLTDYNFKVLNLANNHAFDQDKSGLDHTEKYLAEQKITTLGTGETLDEAWRGKIVEYNDIKIGFVGASYASINDSGKTKNNFVARIEDETRLKSSILDLKSKSDFIVVTMHAGVEYMREPDQSQIDFARAAIDGGADMVIGAHPHWIQTTEKYKGKYIFYSLGNFIFDQMWSQDTREGLTLKVTLEKNADCNYPDQPASRTSEFDDQLLGNDNDCKAQLKQIELIPVIIDNYCCPRIATDEEKRAILQKIQLTSSILK